MTINYLTKKQKRLNIALNIGLLFSALPWLIILPTLTFSKHGGNLITTLIILSLIGVLISLVLGLFHFIIKSKADLTSKDGDYELLVNSSKEVAKIINAGEILGSCNFLVNKTLGVRLEIDNKTAYTLLQQKDIQLVSVKTEERKTRFLEQNPKTLFSDLMSLAWAAS